MSNEKNGEKNNSMEVHEYDGIIEHDNPLPGWWLATFYITVIFSVLYFGYYQMGSGKSLVEEYQDSQKEFQLNIAAQNAGKAPSGPTESELNAALANAGAKSNGKSIYDTKCAACHGNEGQGLIGPNLTDKFWIHGGKITDIANTIAKGVSDKGMPPWEALLSKEELINVAAYVKAFKGSNPANAKAPQGTESND